MLTWRPEGNNDYKHENSAIYDAYGNFKYGATGASYGLTKGQVVARGDAEALARHHAHGNPINRADIEAGHETISRLGREGVGMLVSLEGRPEVKPFRITTVTEAGCTAAFSSMEDALNCAKILGIEIEN